MAGDDRKRFCSDCSLHVYNLSAMRRDEAEALVAGAEGRLCVRFYRRNDGTIMTQNCPVGVQEARQRTFRRIRNTVAGATVMFAGAIGLGGSRQSWASGAVAGNMAAVRPMPPQGDSGMPLYAGGEQGEVVTMGDTTEPVIMGKMSPPEEDTVQVEEQHMMMGMMVIMPEPEEGTSDQPVITPEPIETIGESIPVPEDSAQMQVNVVPVENQHPTIR
jgi:hypothetical protein